MHPPLHFSPASKLIVERNGNDENARLHLVFKGLNNHELRCILVGLWATLPPEDQAEHIEELKHYFAEQERSFLPGLSQMIAESLGKPWKPPAAKG